MRPKNFSRVLSPVTAAKGFSSSHFFCHFFSMAVKSYFMLFLLHSLGMGFPVFAGQDRKSPWPGSGQGRKNYAVPPCSASRFQLALSGPEGLGR